MKGFVVKLGGSLMDQSERVLTELCSSSLPILIVPGGGSFANEVRSLGVDGDAAHWMAISAMEQYGWYLTTFGIPATDALEIPKEGVEILLPYKILREHDPLPHSWDVTSDSLAAWVAGMVGTPLLLLKSVDGITSENHVLDFMTEEIPNDVIDSYCLSVLSTMQTEAQILNARVPGRVLTYLQGNAVCDTILIHPGKSR